MKKGSFGVGKRNMKFERITSVGDTFWHVGDRIPKISENFKSERTFHRIVLRWKAKKAVGKIA